MGLMQQFKELVGHDQSLNTGDVGPKMESDNSLAILPNDPRNFVENVLVVLSVVVHDSKA